MKLRDLLSEEGDAAGTVAADIATVAFPLFVGGRNRKEKFRHGRRAVGMKNVPTKSYIGQGIYEEFVIKHRETGEVLSTHDDLDTARDELEGLGTDQDLYKIVKVQRRPRDWKMNEGVPGQEGDYDEITHSSNLIHWPQGTTLVKVSDVYDWYKIGQTISNLPDADPAKFGKGPPETIIVFGSEAEEHKLLPYLKRLGLGLVDIDDPIGEGYLARDLITHFEKESTA